MKVAHVVKDNVGARFALDEVVYLAERGVDVVTLIPASMPGRMAREYRDAELATIDTDANLYPPRPLSSASNARALRTVLRAVQPDLVHTHHLATTLLARLSTGRRPPFRRIFEVHGPLHLEATHTRASDLVTRGPSDFYIATSKATYSMYRKRGLSADRVTMVYSGSRTEQYVRSRTNKLRNELGIADGTPLVGMIAWMYPPKAILAQRKGLKGHDLFLQAIPRILAKHPDARFAIVGGELSGGQRYASRLRSMAAQLGLEEMLTFVGPRSDVAEIQPDFDVVVHPSRTENPGGAVYTLLAGVPTIGSRVGGIPEIVRDGETGLLIPPDDFLALADAVIHMLEDPAGAREMAARGRKLARELFDISVTAPRVAEFYEHVLRFPP